MRGILILLTMIALVVGSAGIFAFSASPKILDVYITPPDPQAGDDILVHAKVQAGLLDAVMLEYRSYYSGTGSGTGGGTQLMRNDPGTGEYVFRFSENGYTFKDGTYFEFKVVINTMFGLGKRIESKESFFTISSGAKSPGRETSLSVTNFYHLPETPTPNDEVQYRATIENTTDILFVEYSYDSINAGNHGSGSGSMQITKNKEYISSPAFRKITFLRGTQVTYWIIAKDSAGKLAKSQKKTFVVQ